MNYKSVNLYNGIVAYSVFHLPWLVKIENFHEKKLVKICTKEEKENAHNKAESMEAETAQCKTRVCSVGKIENMRYLKLTM